MKIVNLDRLRGLVAALLLACIAAPLFAADDRDAALVAAVMNGDNATLRLLINAGANVDAKADNGMTALILAARNGHLE